VNFCSTYSYKNSCTTSTNLQTGIARFVSDSCLSATAELLVIHCSHPLIKGSTVLHIVLTAHLVWRVRILLTHLFLFLLFCCMLLFVTRLQRCILNHYTDHWKERWCVWSRRTPCSWRRTTTTEMTAIHHYIRYVRQVSPRRASSSTCSFRRRGSFLRSFAACRHRFQVRCNAASYSTRCDRK